MQYCNKDATWKGNPKGYVDNVGYCDKCKANQENRNAGHWKSFERIK